MKRITNATYFIAAMITTLGLSISLQSLLAAWSAPAQDAPGGAYPMAVNVGTSTDSMQSMMGSLAIGSSLNVSGVSSFASNVGIGTTTPEMGLAVVGNVGAQKFCDEKGGNCKTILELVAGASDSIPVGTIMPYAGATAPYTYLSCDGSAVSRATYSDLFAAIGTKYGAGDGSATFNLPDTRGIFLKGSGTTNRASGKDAAGNFYSGTLGQYNTDQFQGHYHNWNGGNGSATSGSGYQYGVSGGQTRASILGPMSDGTNGTPRTGITTEPQSLAVNYFIKAFKDNSASLPPSALWMSNGNDIYNTNTNNIGIGTSSPSSALTVQQKNNSEGVRIISSNYSPFVIRNSSDSSDFFRINQNGNVGIGANNPLAKLSVNSSATYTDTANALIAYDGSGAAGTAVGSYKYPAEFDYSSGGSGNMMRLQIAGYRKYAPATNDWAGAGFRVQTAVDNTYTNGSLSYVYIGTGNNYVGEVSIGTGGADRLTVDSNGNVGIATNNPGFKLDVRGAIYTNGNVRSPLYYDADNLSYYVDPNGTSVMSQLNIGGVDNGLGTYSSPECLGQGGGAFAASGWIASVCATQGSLACSLVSGCTLYTYGVNTYYCYWRCY